MKSVERHWFWIYFLWKNEPWSLTWLFSGVGLLLPNFIIIINIKQSRSWFTYWSIPV